MGAESSNRSLIHATTIAVGDNAMAITGPSGIGKTTLALNCIGAPLLAFNPEPTALVADDRTVITHGAEGLVARAPDSIAGLVEMAGLGLVRIPYRRHARLICFLELSDVAVPRLPELPQTRCTLEQPRPLLTLHRSDAALTVKALSWLAICSGHIDLLGTDVTLAPPKDLDG